MQVRNVGLAGLLFLAACEREAAPVSAGNEQNATTSSAALGTGVPAPAAAGPTPVRASAYTQLVEANCRLIDENKEEGPYWSRRCPGHAGWSMDWHESDLRQDLTMISPDGRKSELGLSSVVANGAFNSIGSTIEWRGVAGAPPDAMILRMSVAASPEGDRPDISRLAVVRLAAPACVVAVVSPRSGQNVRAQQIADGNLPACLSAD